MKKIILILIVVTVFLSAGDLFSKKTDANVFGHVVGNGNHLPYARLHVLGTNIGTVADGTGHYRLLNLPEGNYTLRTSFVGFKPVESNIDIRQNESIEVNIELDEDRLMMEQIVVTADRSPVKRIESSVIVNTISPQIFNNTQSTSVSEGLNFCSGLRMENDCQNCGFSQLRMNGMEGPYSQILINGRAIFSGLAGVYGLELFPTSIIENIEVIRGGGSALYGSNAIAGTVNLILKDPILNSFEAGYSSGYTGVGIENSGNPALDKNINVNISMITEERNAGMSIYGFYRTREPFDANGDDYSEISLIDNTTFGSRLFYNISDIDKVSIDFFNINETRRGGNKFDYMSHEADISEAVTHHITTGALTYEHNFNETDMLSVFGSIQDVSRASYYGANKSLKDYGQSDGLTFIAGSQYTVKFNDMTLVTGIENQGDYLNDKKLGYLDIENATEEGIPHTENICVADQYKNTTGVFAQYDFKWADLKTSVGMRYDHYYIEDLESESENITGNVFSPRLNFLYDIAEYLQGRISFSQGYRAPQIFDEDLHIESSGSRKVTHHNSVDLEQETSNSFTMSLDFNKQFGSTFYGILIESFYTKLNNPFVSTYGTPDENGAVIVTRENAENGATVQGINLEFNFVPADYWRMKAGFTIQSSEYEDAQDFNETKYLRTPNQYGFFTLELTPTKPLNISISGNYTGQMLVPYFGANTADPEIGEVIESDSFFDLGLKASYDFKMESTTLQVYGGIKNMFNSYQNDFDSGIDRDPGYIYGPGLPRTVYAGIKIGNLL